MVSFLKVIVAAATCIPALAALNPTQIVLNMGLLAQKSQALEPQALSITTINGPLIHFDIGPFPKLLAGFKDIVTTANIATAQMQGSTPIDEGAEAVHVADSFRKVRVVPRTSQKLG
jgi:hypothetical protein